MFVSLSLGKDYVSIGEEGRGLDYKSGNNEVKHLDLHEETFKYLLCEASDVVSWL